MTPRSVILMYHGIGDAPDPEENEYAVPTPEFEAQMRWLASHVPTVGLQELSAGQRRDRSAVLTFDDGRATDASVAAPLLRELGLPAAFFVCPDLVGTADYLTWGQLRSLAAQGFRIGSHGLDHSLFAELDDAELRRQLVESKRALEAQLHEEIDALALPGGSGGERASNAARDAGYRVVLGSRPGIVKGVAPAMAVLPRIAVRRRHGLEGLRAAVEQRVVSRLRLGLRYNCLHLAKSMLGPETYRTLRKRWLRASASSVKS
jgi:peptidoglycan/xylan/chitin deacetylase (PgdA/CDA1 family)